MKMFRTIITMLCLMATGYVMASPVPTVVNIRFTSQYNQAGMYWLFTAVGDVVLVENSTIGDRPALSGYRYGFAMNFNCNEFQSGGATYVCTGGNQSHNMYHYFKPQSGETISQVLMRSYQKSGGRFSSNFIMQYSTNPVQGCIGAMYSNSAYGYNYPANQNTFYNYATPVGGETCVIPPQPNQYCDIKTTNIEIDHGLMAPSGSSTQRKPVTINCSANMTVKLSFANKDLTLAPGITSALSVPEAAANGRVSLRQGDNTVNVQSDLTAINAAAGEHQASTVLFLNYL